MPELEIRHNTQAHRFEAGTAPDLARLNYRMKGSSVEMIHTEVPEKFQGQGLAGRLAATALDWARASGLKVIPKCPFVTDYIRKNPGFADLL